MTESGDPAFKVLELIKGRRAIRKFADRPIAEEDLLKVVEAGRWAPSGANRQPWVFIVVDDPDQIGAVLAFSPGVFSRPAAIVAICIDESLDPHAGEADGENPTWMDVAMAAQNIMLEAHSLDIGSCPVLSFDAPSVSRLLGLPAGIRIGLLVTLGYPRKRPAASPRRPLSQVLYRNRFGRQFEGAGQAQAAPQSREPIPHAVADADEPESEAFLYEAFKVITFMLSSAKLLISEPKEYGPLRLIDAAGRLCAALKRSGADDGNIGNLAGLLDVERLYDARGDDAVIRLVDEALAQAASMLSRHAGTDEPTSVP